MGNRAIRAKGGKKYRKTMLYFKAKQWNSLIALSQEIGEPITELVRRAVDSYLKECKQAKIISKPNARPTHNRRKSILQTVRECTGPPPPSS